jgi:GTP pyrophosphokinase
MNVNIHKLTITCDNGIFEGKIEIKVHDRKDVVEIINNLKKINDLEEVNQLI